MSRYEIRHATPADAAAITRFMNENWGSEHPLINNPVFFQHYYMPNPGTLQFCIAQDGAGIAALCGYIRAGMQENASVWVSIWCARGDARGAGLELMGGMPALTGCDCLACNNIRENTMPFYTFLGYTALRLPHFYRLAPKDEYTVASVKTVPSQTLQTGGPRLVLIENFAQLSGHFTPPQGHYPQKDLWYINRRYFEYPFPQQEYLVYGVPSGEGNFSALVVMRCVNVERVNVLRLVDYIGTAEVFATLGDGIGDVMRHYAAEYVDCYCYGISPAAFAAAGFAEREAGSENIIPNYLTPILRENTEYNFFTSRAENFTMFKADGDQDRPNLI